MKNTGRVLFIGLFLGFFAVSCGTTGGHAINTSGSAPSDDTFARLIESNTQAERSLEPADQNSQPEAAEAPAVSVPALTGKHMDGVEFVINNEIKENGLESDQQGVADEVRFPELRSIFDNNRPWHPGGSFNIPVVRNDRVQRWIVAFTGPLRSHFSRWLTRGSHYAPTMEKILRDHNLPTDLVYLSMIESGFNLHAYSSAHAAGPWQFINGTGKMYGLRKTSFIDERRDLIKATEAAANHLSDLYKIYGDWYLSFAAYNAGAGGVNRAIHKAGTKNFWALAAPRSRFLRQETKDYVPRILAAAIISKNYRKYGFSSDLLEGPLAYEMVEVPDSTDVSVIAQCAGATVDEIRFLNPSLMLGVTPPAESYSILLPIGTKKKFEKNYARVPASKRANFAFYKVKKKESWVGIAKKNGISLSKLVAMNDVNTKRLPKPGTTLVIPGKNPIVLGETLLASADDTDVPQDNKSATNPSPAGDTIDEEAGEAPGIPDMQPVNDSDAVEAKENVTQSIRVKKGDNLAKIAKQRSVTVAQLKEWNNLSGKAKIRPGQKLVVSAPVVAVVQVPEQVSDSAVIAAVTAPAEPTFVEKASSTIVHMVRRGETLWDISKKYDVSVAEIKKWNKLNSNHLLPKQKIKILASAVTTKPVG